jgi:D-alanyl-D-alanine carboxypeptidase/D-alanyl-D-alanine-endopeptidase (penicillin-binding protein 4)
LDNWLLKTTKHLILLNFLLLKTFRYLVYYPLIILLLGSCAAHKYKDLRSFTDKTLNKGPFEQQFTGLLVIDPASGDTLYRQNSTKYFTPASNTKLFTLYAGLKLLPDSIPSLLYCYQNDTLFIAGTGNPALLHPYFHDSTALGFIRDYPRVAFVPDNLADTPWGPGWAWEDFDGYYSAERSALPLYGNVVQVFKSDSLMVSPGYFGDKVKQVRYKTLRKQWENTFFYPPESSDTLFIPMKTDSSLTRVLLEKASGKKIITSPRKPERPWHTLYGIPTDSIYKRMMQESDNFLAEQILLTASSTLSDTLNSALTRQYIMENHLKGLRQPPVWVDGSGLSRYNLFSPESIVEVLSRMYREIPGERLFSLFAAGGVSGTLADWYPGIEEPYIFAKTGTLANNHCLSGYLKTRSGKVLIFSIMNNHYTQPTSSLKESIRKILEELRDHY